VRHVGGPASLVIGGYHAGPSSGAQRLQALFEQCGVSAQASLDVWPQLWEKFLFVAPFGGLGAAVDAPIGRLRATAGLRALLVAAMREIADVGRALGIDLAPDVVERSLAFVDQQPAAGTTSLQRDLLASRPSELEAWSGAVVRLGLRAGVDTPINRVLYEVLDARDGRGRTVVR
jgi:2-dehydropantoate 2-reductase